MKPKTGAVVLHPSDRRVPLAEGDVVPCPLCDARHVVLRDPRPGRSHNIETGIETEVPNTVLYVECPQSPGPIVVGMDGYALPKPLALTPRPKPQ